MKSLGMLSLAAGVALAALGIAGSSSAASVVFQERSAAPPNNACDRACLDGWADRYMAALVAHDVKSLPWAKGARFSENNVMLKPGDGLWKTISSKGEKISELHFADVPRQTAGFFSIVKERDVSGFFALRLKIVDGQIVEAETNISRQAPRPAVAPAAAPRPAAAPAGAPAAGPGAGAGGGTGFTTSTPEAFRHYEAFGDVLPAAERVGRGRYQDIGNGYWATMQLNDGQLLTKFAVDCGRVEDGAITSGGVLPNGQRRMTCGEQFATGNYRTDTDVRDREAVLIDEEKGLVLYRAFIDHNAAAKTLRNIRGEERPSGQRQPSTFSLLELFKIKNGEIWRVEVVHTNVPYRMPSPWRRVDADFADPAAYAAWSGGAK